MRNQRRSQWVKDVSALPQLRLPGPDQGCLRGRNQVLWCHCTNRTGGVRARVPCPVCLQQGPTPVIRKDLQVPHVLYDVSAQGPCFLSRVLGGVYFAREPPLVITDCSRGNASSVNLLAYITCIALSVLPLFTRMTGCRML